MLFEESPGAPKIMIVLQWQKQGESSRESCYGEPSTSASCQTHSGSSINFAPSLSLLTPTLSLSTPLCLQFHWKQEKWKHPLNEKMNEVRGHYLCFRKSKLFAHKENVKAMDDDNKQFFSWIEKKAYRHWPPHSVAPIVILADKQTHRLVNWQIVAQPTLEGCHKWDPWSVARSLTPANLSKALADNHRTMGCCPAQWHEDLKNIYGWKQARKR